MKAIEDVTVCVVDYGKFTFLAEKFAEKAFKTYYHTPFDREFVDVNDCVKGTGLPGVERLDDFLDPNVFPEIDLFVFPDIGLTGVQRHLRELGKAVWGAMGATELELSRTKFIKTVESLGLSTVTSVTVKGVTNLALHLKDKKEKWIKMNRFRACMETWHHIDMDHSRHKLDSLSVRLGAVKEHVIFVVQDTIDSDVEIGYDGWCVDGNYPEKTFQGYELKNELYLGSVLSDDKLPDQIKTVNDAMAPLLADYGYRNFIATEIRVKDDIPYYIDPTHRMPGLTGDQLPETCENLAEVIWHGANGELIEPNFICKFSAVATLHYKNHVPHEWFSLNIPDDVRRWFKLYHFCKIDGRYAFIPSVPFECDEPGTVIGIGDSIEDAIDHLKENLECIRDEPVSAEVEGFSDLIKQVDEAQKMGMKFSKKPLPDPLSILD